MIGTLIVLCVSALLLKFVVGLVGGVERGRNKFTTAFIVSAILAVLGHLLEGVDGGLLLRIAYTVSWLFVVKSFYGMGWFRAFFVGVVLVLVLTAIKVAPVTAGLVSLGALAVLL